MRKGVIEIWNVFNTSLLGEADIVDGDGVQRNFDRVNPTGKKYNEAGNGELTLQSDHPLVLDGHATRGNVVRLYSQDTTTEDPAELVHAFRITGVKTREIGASEAQQDVELSGVGLLDDWSRAVVDPWFEGRPISLDRVFNWAAPLLNLTTWSTTTYLQTRTDVPQVRPEAWPIPDEFAQWIFSRADSTSQPVGTSLFRNQFTLDADAWVVFYIAADNTFELWLDGTLVEREPNKQPDKSGFEQTRRYVVRVSAGTHYVGVAVTNWTGVEVNPAGFIFGCFEVDDWRIGEAILTSATTSGWKCLDYPTTNPGYTAPEIIGILLAEAQDRDELLWWTINVVGSHDVIPEFIPRVGTNYREVLEALIATHINVTVDDEGLVLNVYPKDYTNAVELTVGVPAFQTVTVNDAGDFWNAVQGLWAEGVEWREDAASISAYGRRAKSLPLAGERIDLPSVRKILDEWLAAHSEPPRSVITQQVDIEGVVAGIDYKVGDTVSDVNGEELMCVGITWIVGESGELKPTPEWDTLFAVRRKERIRAVERMISQFEQPGNAAILGSQSKIPSGVPSTMEITWSWSEDIEDSLNEVDPEKPWQVKRIERPQRLYEFSVEIAVDDLPDAFGDTTIELLKNGVLLNGLYNLTLTTAVAKHTVRIYGYEVVEPTDSLQVRCVAAGGHVDGTINLRLADPV